MLQPTSAPLLKTTSDEKTDEQKKNCKKEEWHHVRKLRKPKQDEIVFLNPGFAQLDDDP